jgi:hypothetical protein
VFGSVEIVPETLDFSVGVESPEVEFLIANTTASGRIDNDFGFSNEAVDSQTSH